MRRGPAMIMTAVAGFAAGDTIDLTGFLFKGRPTTTVSGSGAQGAGTLFMLAANPVRLVESSSDGGQIR